MAIQPVGFRPPQTAYPGSLKGYSGSFDAAGVKILPPIPAGIIHATEVVLARFQCPRIGCPVLEDLYIDGDASGSGYLHFRVTANGVTLPFDWADSYSAIGQAGIPRVISENLPAGALIEIRCKNEHGADDTLKAYCDGNVGLYERPI